MLNNYVMDPDGTVRVEPDLLTWAAWMETADCQIADDTIAGVRVSTVFLGIDHSFTRGAVPVLFETMIFSGEDTGHAADHDGECYRYHTRAEALAGHALHVERVRGAVTADEATMVEREGG